VPKVGIMKDIIAVILAAGKGTRMGNTDWPKVMFKANNKPIVECLVQSIQAAGVNDIVLVVGYLQEQVRKHFKDRVQYVEQREQKGTGHAVMMAKDLLKGKSKAVLVSYGDMPLYKIETIKKLIEKFNSPAGGEKPVIAMVTVDLADPDFWAYGRVLRDKNREIVATVEQKDATEEQRKIKECNPSFYLFDSDWLWDNLSRIGTNNVQKEYYLPDLISIAASQGKKIVSIKAESEDEVLGVNTPEQLEKVAKILKKR
jgi:bifunctional UDP-N-acetylglucosamine pyrophosphorylase/glucosamine-1-phosphate N-acetyltransferase